MKLHEKKHWHTYPLFYFLRNVCNLLFRPGNHTKSTVKTVEEFWDVYNFLRRPNDLPTTTDIHFFRDGVKPTWEDPSNSSGGKWIVRLPKGLASRYWEEVILALIGGQLLLGSSIPDGEITGVVIAVRYNEDILGIWNKSAFDREIVERLRDGIKRVLQLPPHAPMVSCCLFF